MDFYFFLKKMQRCFEKKKGFDEIFGFSNIDLSILQNQKMK